MAQAKCAEITTDVQLAARNEQSVDGQSPGRRARNRPSGTQHDGWPGPVGRAQFDGAGAHVESERFLVSATVADFDDPALWSQCVERGLDRVKRGSQAADAEGWPGPRRE